MDYNNPHSSEGKLLLYCGINVIAGSKYDLERKISIGNAKNALVGEPMTVGEAVRFPKTEAALKYVAQARSKQAKFAENIEAALKNCTLSGRLTFNSSVAFYQQLSYDAQKSLTSAVTKIWQEFDLSNNHNWENAVLMRSMRQKLMGIGWRFAKQLFLSAFMWVGTFSLRNNTDLLTSSGLMSVDFDHLDDGVEPFMEKLKSDPLIFAAQRSPSGNGVKVEVRIPDDAAGNPLRFRACFETFERYVAMQYPTVGVGADKAAKAIGQLCFFMHDPDCFYFQESYILQPDPELIKVKKTSPSANGQPSGDSSAKPIRNPKTKVERGWPLGKYEPAKQWEIVQSAVESLEEWLSELPTGRGERHGAWTKLGFAFGDWFKKLNDDSIKDEAQNWLLDLAGQYYAGNEDSVRRAMDGGNGECGLGTLFYLAQDHGNWNAPWKNQSGKQEEVSTLHSPGKQANATAHSNGPLTATILGFSPIPLKAYYDGAGKTFWIQDSRGVWIEIHESAMRRHLKQCGFSPLAPKNECLSPLERELNRMQMEECIDYAGPLAGCSVGVVNMGGKRVLVKDSPQLIEPKSGECPTIDILLNNLFCGQVHDQLPHVLGWLKIAVESLRSGSRRPGQALAIAGEHDSGKSLFQKLVTHILGGRSAKPYRYMSGGTDFNGELFGAEHQMIEDDVSVSDLRGRRSFGAKIKDLTVNEVQSCHAKNRQAISLEPFWRLTITLNCEPENMMILPPIDQSLEDKIILLMAYKKPMPMPTRTDQQRAAYWAKLVSELPAFIHRLMEWEIPPTLKSERFGVTHFHHPELLSAIDAMSPESRLLALIDLELFKEENPNEWHGTAEELEKALVVSGSNHHAKQLLSWPNATGTYLGRLASKQPQRFTSSRTNIKRSWKITKA